MIIKRKKFRDLVAMLIETTNVLFKVCAKKADYITM